MSVSQFLVDNFISFLTQRIGVSASSYETGFMEWSLLHAKNYSTEEEAKIRETIFAENTVVVESLNRQYKERYVSFSYLESSALGFFFQRCNFQAEPVC